MTFFFASAKHIKFDVVARLTGINNGYTNLCHMNNLSEVICKSTKLLDFFLKIRME